MEELKLFNTKTLDYKKLWHDKRHLLMRELANSLLRVQFGKDANILYRERVDSEAKYKIEPYPTSVNIDMLENKCTKYPVITAVFTYHPDNEIANYLSNLKNAYNAVNNTYCMLSLDIEGYEELKCVFGLIDPDLARDSTWPDEISIIAYSVDHIIEEIENH